MRVAIAGGHGKIALALAALLSERGDQALSLIRNPAHEPDVRDRGGTPIQFDLEAQPTPQLIAALEPIDAVVFAAGAGPGSGPERKLTVDRDGAIKLLDAARTSDVPSYVIISSVGAEDPPDDDDVFSVYLRAKAEADRALAASDRAWTIVRPGFLTDDPGTGRVSIQTDPIRDRVTRDDVAGVLAAVLAEPRSARLTIYVAGGEDPIEHALEAVLP